MAIMCKYNIGQMLAKASASPMHPQKVTVWCGFFAGGIMRWPPRSCDLTPLNFFLWGYLKSKVYANKPTTIQELKNEITRHIGEIEEQLCRDVIKILDHRTFCRHYLSHIIAMNRFTRLNKEIKNLQRITLTIFILTYFLLNGTPCRKKYYVLKICFAT